MLIRRVFALEVRDVNFAFKLFKTSFLKNIVLVSEGSVERCGIAAGDAAGGRANRRNWLGLLPQGSRRVNAGL